MDTALIRLSLVATASFLFGCSNVDPQSEQMVSAEDELAAGTHAFWEVVAVEPEAVIKHGVELKGYFDDEKSSVSLSGPELVSQAVGAVGRLPATPIAHLNWYRITKGESEEHGQVTLRDSLVNSESYTVNVKGAAFLLSPAQRLKDGPPDAVPAGLNHFKAYAIEPEGPIELSVELTNTFTGETVKREVRSAAFLCLPAEEWHHEEYFGIADADRCFVVYALEPLSVDTRATTMDQFGIHTLKVASSDWICVSATVQD